MDSLVASAIWHQVLWPASIVKRPILQRYSSSLHYRKQIPPKNRGAKRVVFSPAFLDEEGSRSAINAERGATKESFRERDRERAHFVGNCRISAEEGRRRIKSGERAAI